MAATAIWQEDNGAATGTPPKGSSRGNASNVNWKSVDDRTTSIANATIFAGQNSFHKYQFVRITGSFNEVSAGKFAHTVGSLGTGLSLKGKVTSSYSTPSTGALSGSTDISAASDINNGMNVLFSTTGPEASSPAATLSAAGYTQYIATQLQTQQTAAAGDTGEQTLVFQWNEN